MPFVKAPLVLATNSDGKVLYLYAGTQVPSDLPKSELERLADFFEPDPEPVVDDDGADIPDGDPSADWKVPQLKAYAKANDIDLGEATKKDDILAVLTSTD